MTPLYIFDLDGTLADCTHRQHFIQAEKQNWDAFYAMCHEDVPIGPVIRTLQQLQSSGADCWIFSGRSDRVRDLTEQWLLLAANIDPASIELVMRPDGDYTPDDELKQRFLDNMLLNDLERLVAVFDDRQRVVDMWRRNDVTCFQVAPGDF